MLLIKKKTRIFGLLIRFHSSEFETIYLVVYILLVFNSFQTVSLFEFYNNGEDFVSETSPIPIVSSIKFDKIVCHLYLNSNLKCDRHILFIT